MASDQRWVFDPVRKKWLVFTPEEFVRQLLVQYLILERDIPATRISLEKAIEVNGLLRRYDMVIYNRNLEAKVLVECKASSIDISQDTFDQIFQYNSVLEIPFLLVTNGRDTFCLKENLEGDGNAKMPFTFLSKIPYYTDL